MSDLPDYTRLVTVNVVVPPLQNFMIMKAEAVTKKVIYAQHELSVNVAIIASAANKKIGILKILATTDGAGGSLKLQSRQSAALATVFDSVNIEANAPLDLNFPCWVPTQDASDTTNPQIVISQSGACGEKLTIVCWYYEEDA